LTLSVRSNPDFDNSILELKVYGLLLDLREDFINSFLDLLDGVPCSYVTKFEPVINNN
jgi:hypothetical protein